MTNDHKFDSIVIDEGIRVGILRGEMGVRFASLYMVVFSSVAILADDIGTDITVRHRFAFEFQLSMDERISKIFRLAVSMDDT